ncbi:hypothetical protein V2J09_012919 [Rumex salicifolius]
MCGRFIRIRVLMDLKKPLRRGIMVACGTRKIWAKVKYERLPNFRYNCGVLGHIDLDCDDEEARGFQNEALPMKVKDLSVAEKATEQTFWSSMQKGNGEDGAESSGKKQPEVSIKLAAIG